MSFFSRLSSKKKFSDGSWVYESGWEFFTYENPTGQRVDFVWYRNQRKISGFDNVLIVSLEDKFTNGELISPEIKLNIIEKCKEYFFSKKQTVSIN